VRAVRGRGTGDFHRAATRVKIILALSGLVFAMDQATKAAVIRSIPFHESIPVTSFFSLVHVQNTGAAFGIFQDSNKIFIVMTALILAFISLFYRRELTRSPATAWGVGLLWGGALGNLTDRIFRGGVVDFLDFFWKTLHWPAFNVADSAISTGIVLLAWASVRAPRPGSPESAPADSRSS
jgi:signal peptidase II